MDDRKKTIAALTIAVGGIVLVVIIIGVNHRQKVVSPVPDEGAIRVIFISPTLPAIATET